MLIVTRRTDEKIVIDTPQGLITVMVVEIRSGSVRIGVEAPKDFAVDRLEVRERILASQGKDAK